MDRRRGFTLLELMVTVAIVGILVAITAGAVRGIRPRSQLATAGADISAILKSVPDRAVASGAVYWVGWIPATADEGAKVVVYKDWNGNFSPAALPTAGGALDVATLKKNASDDKECAAANCRQDSVETVLELPKRVEQVPASKFGTIDNEVPGPYRVWTDFNAEGSTGCSFCNTDNPSWTEGCAAPSLASGWIRFLPRGEARIYCEPLARGGFLVLGSVPNGGGEPTNVQLITITTPFVLSGSFFK